MRDPQVDEFVREQQEVLVAKLSAFCGDVDVAEDAAQEALARACERWSDVREMEAPGGWLYRVGLNLTRSHYRRRSTERRVREQLVDPSVWDLGADPAVRVALVRAMETLPVRRRAAVAMRYLLDWSVADVAAALGTSESAVKSLSHRGIADLRDHFDGERAALRRRVIRGGGAIALVLVGVVAAAVLGWGENSAPVYVDVPPPGGADLSVVAPTGGAVLEIDGEHVVVLDGQLLGFVTSLPSGGGHHLDVAFGDVDRFSVRGEVPGVGTPTSDGLVVTAVVNGVTFVSRSGECEVSVVSRPVTAQGGLPSGEGHVVCSGWQGSPDEEPVDIEARFRVYGAQTSRIGP